MLAFATVMFLFFIRLSISGQCACAKLTAAMCSHKVGSESPSSHRATGTWRQWFTIASEHS